MRPALPSGSLLRALYPATQTLPSLRQAPKQRPRRAGPHALLELLEPVPRRLDAPAPDDDDLNDQQPDHEGEHAGDAIGEKQRHDDVWRDDGRAAAEHVADAVGAQPHLGREQFRRIDAVENGGVDVDADDQQETDAEGESGLLDEGIDGAEDDR